jgi:hypothetical protein
MARVCRKKEGSDIWSRPKSVILGVGLPAGLFVCCRGEDKLIVSRLEETSHVHDFI